MTAEDDARDGYGSILTGAVIKAEVEMGGITISPFRDEQVNGASYDIRLGGKFAVYDRWVQEHSGGPRLDFYCTKKVLDIKKEKDFAVTVYEIPEEGLVLQPGILYLMHTLEVVRTNKYEPVLDGKSSVGRLGVFIHVTAAFGDPFFEGQYTLEVMAVHPIRIYAGIRVGQMRFHTLVGEPCDYRSRGSYVGVDAMGPVPSKLHRQFK